VSIEQIGWPLAALALFTLGLPVVHWVMGPIRRRNGGR